MSDDVTKDNKDGIETLEGPPNEVIEEPSSVEVGEFSGLESDEENKDNEKQSDGESPVVSPSVSPPESPRLSSPSPEVQKTVGEANEEPQTESTEQVCFLSRCSVGYDFVWLFRSWVTLLKKRYNLNKSRLAKKLKAV